MMVLRSLVFLLLQTGLTVFFAVFAVCTFPLSILVRYRLITGWNRAVIWLARWICGIRYQVIGMENMPAVPAIVMAKHQSAWETIALPILLPPMAIVLKREILKIPFFGWGMAMLSPIAIDRGDGRAALKQITEQGKQRLSVGLGILIFPEGTRVAAGQVGKYGIGGAWLATHAHSLVIPIAHNAGELWPKNALLKRAGLITVSIGPVIDPAGMKPDALNQRVQAWIENEMAHLPTYAQNPKK